MKWYMTQNIKVCLWSRFEWVGLTRAGSVVEILGVDSQCMITIVCNIKAFIDHILQHSIQWFIALKAWHTMWLAFLHFFLLEGNLYPWIPADTFLWTTEWSVVAMTIDVFFFWPILITGLRMIGNTQITWCKQSINHYNSGMLITWCREMSFILG